MPSEALDRHEREGRASRELRERGPALTVGPRCRLQQDHGDRAKDSQSGPTRASNN
jgi:hypothetical protein